jgi:hypothetical protein
VVDRSDDASCLLGLEGLAVERVVLTVWGSRTRPTALICGQAARSYSLVRPPSFDLAVDGLRWRHPLRWFLRVRVELTAADLAGEMLVAVS